MANSKIPTRELGKSGVKVGEIGLGLMRQSSVPFADPGTDPSVSREPWFNVMKKAIDSGCTFWNTGEIYGDNEMVLREFFEKNPGSRDQVFISVKAGIDMAARGANGDPEFIRANVDTNLQRLGLPRIDLYQMARVDPKVPIEVTVRALADLVKAGKIGHIGLSEVSADTIRRAHKVHPITCVEVEYSLWTRDPESNGVLKTCEELGIALVAYSPLGQGFLAGKYKSPDQIPELLTKLGFPRFGAENFDKNTVLLNLIEKIAAKYSITPAQLCLVWLLAQSPVIVPIPGTTQVDRLVSNLESCKHHLTKEELKEIRDAVSSIEVHGGRYPPTHSANLNGNTKPLE